MTFFICSLLELVSVNQSAIVRTTHSNLLSIELLVNSILMYSKFSKKISCFQLLCDIVDSSRQDLDYHIASCVNTKTKVKDDLKLFRSNIQFTS